MDSLGEPELLILLAILAIPIVVVVLVLAVIRRGHTEPGPGQVPPGG